MCAQPTSYTRQADFSDYQASNPTDPLDANDVDLEFDSVKQTLDEILTNLVLIQRDDGAIANSSVHKDAFDADALALIGGSAGWTPKGDWSTSTSYSAKDMVRQSGNTYVAVEDHTAGTFATDLAAGKWLQLVDPKAKVDADDDTAEFLEDKLVSGAGVSITKKTSGSTKTLEFSSASENLYAADAGAADAYEVTLDPAPSSYVAGMVVRFRAANKNTGASTIDVNGIGAASIKRKRDGGNLQAGDIQANAVYTLVYDGTNFRIESETQASESLFGTTRYASTAEVAAGSASSRAVTPGEIVPYMQKGAPIWGGTSGGTANAQTLSLTPSLTAYAAGMLFRFQVGTTNTGAVTLNVDSVGAKNIKTRGGAALESGELVAGEVVEVIYNGTEFRLQKAIERTIVYESSDTWTKKTGLVKLRKAEAVGGGGSSAATADTSGGEASVTGGGGGGGYACKHDIPAGDLGATETVTVGAGGSAPAAGTVNANDGADSSFGSHVVAGKGSGGSSSTGAVVSGDANSNGGLPGVGTTGDVKASGDYGQAGLVINGEISKNGYGGGTVLGGIAYVGVAGRKYGGGGGGQLSSSTTSQPGLAGADGVVIVVEEY